MSEVDSYAKYRKFCNRQILEWASNGENEWAMLFFPAPFRDFDNPIVKDHFYPFGL